MDEIGMEATGTDATVADPTASDPTASDPTATAGERRHDIPSPPPPPADEPVASGPYVANPFVYESPPLAPGQLAPGWKSLFITGWLGVLIGYGCIWQAARVAGIAPWWLGPETNPRLFVVIALPFITPLLALASAALGSPRAVYAGVIAGLASMAVSLGDFGDHPGLAAGEAVIGFAGLLVTIACFAGRMRRPTERARSRDAAPRAPDIPRS